MLVNIKRAGFFTRSTNIYSNNSLIGTVQQKGFFRDFAILTSTTFNKAWRINDIAFLKPSYQVIDISNQEIIGSFSTSGIVSYLGKLILKNHTFELVSTKNSESEFYWKDESGNSVIKFSVGEYSRWGGFKLGGIADLPDNYTEEQMLLLFIGSYLLTLKIILLNSNI